MIKNILFSIDFTLIDSYECVKNSFFTALASVNYEKSLHFDFDKVCGLPLSPMFHIALNTESSEEVNQAIHVFRKEFSKYYIHQVSLNPGVIPLLTQLKEEGYLLGIFSNRTHQNVKEILRFFDIEKFFNIFITEEDVLLHTETDNPILSLISQYLLRPSEVLLVGGTVFDINMAIMSGCYTIGVMQDKNVKIRSDKVSPDLQISSIADLRSALNDPFLFVTY